MYNPKVRRFANNAQSLETSKKLINTNEFRLTYADTCQITSHSRIKCYIS